MLNFFNNSSSNLDSKIEKLASKIKYAQPIFGNPSQYEWDDIFELCKEINEYFKNVRYPTKQERDVAWQKFFNLRDEAHKVRRSQLVERSKGHYNELISRLNQVDYNTFTDFVVGNVLSVGFLKATPDEMRENGKELGIIGAHFKRVKHEMIKEHKIAIHERMVEVRRNHDVFWGKYKNHQIENSKLYNERQQARQEKQEKSKQIKSRIESNIENNKGKLHKAQNALDHFERKRDELKNKIYNSSSDNWKSKAEGWLSDFNNKIEDIKSHINRIEKWIEEDRDKLNNWN